MIDFDFEPYFSKYEALRAVADASFERVRQEYPQCVKCAPECCDCCHALFDVTLVEALYVNRKFRQRFEGQRREELLERSNRADRRIHQIKRRAMAAHKKGVSEDDILAQLALERVRCPLLKDTDTCEMYEDRPLTCRFYGIPTAIGGAGHTCGLSDFKAGESYPTVNLDAVHRKLYEISAELVRDLRSRFSGLAEMLVPLSMALLTDYDEEYLGTNTEGDTEDGGSGAGEGQDG